MAESILDLTLGLVLIVLAAGALFLRNLLANVTLFIAFGIVLAITWVHLNAVDLALAEAAIGAGLTGVLLLSAAVHCEPESARPDLRRRWWVTGAVLIGIIATLITIGLSPLSSDPPAARASELALQNVDHSGVSHSVTAVLLNFRAWDTLLELTVLLLALLGVRQLHPLHKASSVQPWPALEAWSSWLVPLLVLVAGYVLWRGASGPGGAFQAGALLAAALVILRLGLALPALSWAAWPLRGLTLMSVALFLIIAAATHWLGTSWLNYGDYSKWLIVLVESAATVSIAITLTLMLVGEEKELSA